MLPKFQTPVFSIIQPSTKKEIRYRPFLVKEEKILLMAKESDDKSDVYNAIKQVVNNCVMEENFDVDMIPIYDLEYLFIKIRSASVNNIVKFQVEDSDDSQVYNLEVDLNDVEVIFPKNHSNKIMISDTIGVVMSYPTPALSEKIKNMSTATDIIYETILNCIEYVFDEEDTYPWIQEPAAEKQLFLESIPIDVYQKFNVFFNTAPKIEHVVKYVNSEGTEKKVVFRNINDFFMLY